MTVNPKILILAGWFDTASSIASDAEIQLASKLRNLGYDVTLLHGLLATRRWDNRLLQS